MDREDKCESFRQSRKLSTQNCHLCLLLFPLCDLCRQTRLGSPKAVPRTVPAWQGTSVAGISTVPQGLGAKTMVMAVVTVPKLVRKPWEDREGVCIAGQIRNKTKRNLVS